MPIETIYRISQIGNIVIPLMTIPCVLLIYRYKLLSLKLFMEIKKNPSDKEGSQYKWYFKAMNILFCCAKARNQPYLQYLQYKKKNL